MNDKTKPEKSKNTALIQARKIEMNSPYDLQTCIEKLADLEKDARFLSGITVEITRPSDKHATFDILCINNGTGKSRGSGRIKGELRAAVDGTTDVWGKVPKQDMGNAIGLLVIVAVLIFFILVPVGKLGHSLAVVTVIFIPFYLVLVKSLERQDANYILELIRDALE